MSMVVPSRPPRGHVDAHPAAGAGATPCDLGSIGTACWSLVPEGCARYSDPKKADPPV